ncbi:hypothetical protein [Bacillus toyonensis]|uniref:hypothetical protein n=1 Tax=Bacillus toyonensis TaxID=155322 RepID=UPI003D65605C
MAQKSHMNVNDVYPILDMINRKVNQGKGTRHHFTSPLFNNDNDNGVTTLNSSQWQVESFEVIRETENSIANHVINEIRIIYRNGAIDKISLVRGLNPSVSDEIQDYEYINNIMITEVSIRTEWFGKSQEVVAKIIRENDYGNFKKVKLTYFDSEWGSSEEEIEEDSMPSKYENPSDFYNGKYSNYEEVIVEDYVDYAEIGYASNEEIEISPDGWSDGYNPSSPVDVNVELGPKITDEI